MEIDARIKREREGGAEDVDGEMEGEGSKKCHNDYIQATRAFDMKFRSGFNFLALFIAATLWFPFYLFMVSSFFCRDYRFGY